MKSNVRRIGILGGTFNPIHLGHLVLAEESRVLLGLEKIIFVPANFPPHKGRQFLAPAAERYAMITLAVKTNPYFLVSDLEVERGGVSYSIVTIKKLKSIFPKSRLYFIVGSDFLGQFSTWKDINELSKICKFVIASRPTHKLSKLPRNMRAIKITPLEISATDIRKRLKNGRSVRYLLPEEVRRYILKKRLYR